MNLRERDNVTTIQSHEFKLYRFYENVAVLDVYW